MNEAIGSFVFWFQEPSTATLDGNPSTIERLVLLTAPSWTYVSGLEPSRVRSDKASSNVGLIQEISIPNIDTSAQAGSSG